MLFKPLESNQTPRHILDESQQDEFDQTVPELTKTIPLINFTFNTELPTAEFVVVTSEGFKSLFVPPPTSRDNKSPVQIGYLTVTIKQIKKIKSELLGHEEEDEDYHNYLQYYQEKDSLVEPPQTENQFITFTSSKVLYPKVPIYVISVRDNDNNGKKVIVVALPSTLANEVSAPLRKALFEAFPTSNLITISSAPIEANQKGSAPSVMNYLVSSMGIQTRVFSPLVDLTNDLQELEVPNLISGPFASLMAGAELYHRAGLALIINNYGISYGGMEYIETGTKRIIISLLESLWGGKWPTADVSRVRETGSGGSMYL
ncbi:hypothetical protein NADFUDRAFT_40160 [Nadsonia fulvescens var. elongata DSM 6958]|uniref:Uncharacterized protein n=1 Tax=Nadsonia fulvescens var. elongata DSM 6958 TaxID=857566 RepID=A0A1E3PP11_9ASCO|nr:hypothetical protein NADFUDRAFT_40160 [Nadsonia fulvescens var. elongata DSM 6958]